MSSLLFRVLHANKCTSTHHKIAMDALLHLESIHAAQWQNVFVKHVEVYLDGSKAPDKKFKDFRNHVLHVKDNYWGGAVVKSEEWYKRLCEFLNQEDWSRAVYSAGVLSHYITDPFMPLHTAQSEAEGAVHRACEWSVAKSYDSLLEDLQQDLDGFPSISLGRTDDWLAMAIIDGAQEANQHYETLIDHYNLDLGVKDPEAGLDQECRDIMSRMLGRAVITFSRILDKAFDQTGVKPPELSVSVAGFLTSVTTPVYWLTKRMANGDDKAAVKAIYREVQETKRVLAALPEDERTVRELHAKEVLGVSVRELEDETPREAGTKYGTGTPWRSRAPEVSEEPERESEQQAADSESDEATQSESAKPTKFGQSAWRERRRKRRQEAAAEVPEQPEVEEPVVPEPHEAATTAETMAPVAAAAATTGLVGRAFGKFKRSKRVVEDAEPTDEELEALTAPDQPAHDAAASKAAEVDQAYADYSHDSAEHDSNKEKRNSRLRRKKRKAVEPDPAINPFEEAAANDMPPGYDDHSSANEAPVDDEAPVVFQRVAQEPDGPKFYLNLDSPIVDAPSIGGGTAKRLRKAGIRTVGDLLECDVELIAEATRASYVTPESLTDWQNQARLQCRVPGLRGHDSQILVACGFSDPNALASMHPDDLMAIVEPFANTEEGEKILRTSPPPNTQEVTNWIEWAGLSRSLRAA